MRVLWRKLVSCLEILYFEMATLTLGETWQEMSVCIFHLDTQQDYFSISFVFDLANEL